MIAWLPEGIILACDSYYLFVPFQDDANESNPTCGVVTSDNNPLASGNAAGAEILLLRGNGSFMCLLRDLSS